jgi:uncharacterized protein Usg
MVETSVTAFEKRLMGYKLTTAEILYHLPDHPKLLQSFVWQELDMAPRFPVLNRFLDFWSAEIEGKLHSVRVAVSGVFSPSELKLCAGEFRLH